MGGRKKKEDVNKKGSDINLGWFLVAAVVASIGFFAFSVWIRTPPVKVIHRRSHLDRKPIVMKEAPKRNRDGYKVSY